VATDLEQFVSAPGRDELVKNVREQIDAAGVTYIAVTGIEDNEPLMASSRLIGPSIGLLGVGILALLVVPPVDAAVRARRRLQVLRPLWEDLQGALPGIRLSQPERDRLSAAAAVERAVIEIRDALAVIPIEPPTAPGVDGVAERLISEVAAQNRSTTRPPSAAREAAAAFLTASRTQGEDAEQVHALALAYRRRLLQQERGSHASEPVAVPGASA